MSTNNDKLSDLIRYFAEQELHIKENNTPEKRLEHESNIINAYNNIIRHTIPYWDSNDSTLIAQIRDKLSNIYYRTKDILQILNSSIELPTNLKKEVIVEQKPTIDTEQNEDTNETPNNKLGSKLEYDEETFQTLIDEFNEWDKKITRKNASERPDIVEYRTQKIIEAYNNLIDFSKPLIEQKDDETKQDIENKLQTIRDNIIDDLNLLNANVDVPDDLTKKIENPNNNSENNNKQNNNTSNSGDQKPNNDNQNSNTPTNPIPKKPTKKPVMAETNFTYLSSISRIINNTYKGDPNGLNAFITAIELADASSTAEQQTTLVKFIKTKLEGKALEALPENVNTATDIINALREKIKPDTSKVVIGRLLALRAERNALQKFQQQAEELADQLRRAYISEGMTHNLAEKTTIDKTVEMCRLSAKTNLVKSVLASSQFSNPKEVLAKLVTETTAENGEAQVLYFRHNGHRGRNFNNSNNFNNFNNRNNRQNYRQNNDNRGNFGQQRGNFRGNFRSNGRGRGTRRFFNRNYNQNGNNNNASNNRHVRIINEENGQSPAPQRGQTVTLEDIQN